MSIEVKATLNESEFCRSVGISRTKAWDLRKSGKLSYCKVGTRILYKPEHIEQFLTAHEKLISTKPKPINKQKRGQ